MTAPEFCRDAEEAQVVQLDRGLDFDPLSWQQYVRFSFAGSEEE